MTAFTIGNEVIATTSAQGLAKGRRYKIVDITTTHSAFGTFAYYSCKDAVTDEPVKQWIRNGHLILERSDR